MPDNMPPIQRTHVQEILTRLAAVASQEMIKDLPDLQPAEVKAALTYAAEAVGQHPPETVPNPAQIEEALLGQEPTELDSNKILLVDDIEENLIIIQYMFKESGYSLSLARTAEEALEKARTELPILIISDVQMPRMSGIDLLQALKADERTRNIAVILVTAHHRTPTHVSQGLQMGADDYIYRPFVRDEFMSRVEAVMRVKWAETEAQRQARVIARRNKGLELVNELALAVSSSLDLQEIFASSMQKLSQLLNAGVVSLILLNEEKQELRIDISSRTGKRISASLGPIIEKTTIPNNLLQKFPAAIAQILDDHRVELELESKVDPETIQLIPMRTREHTIGAIAIANNNHSSLDEADWVLLHSAAGIIAVAVENTRLLENAQQLVDDLIALNEIGRTLNSTLDLDQILKLTTMLVQRSVEAEAASFWFIEEKGRELVLTASSGMGSETVTGYRMSIDNGLVGYVARTGEAYNAIDVLQEEDFFSEVAKKSNYYPRSILSVPVTAKGEIIGVMQALHQRKNWFDQNDLSLCYPIASSVGIAVENARLFSEIQNFNRHLEQMVAARTGELAAEKEKVEAILASMADGLLVLDAKNHLLTANVAAEEMLAFALDDLKGQTISPERLKNPVWSCIIDMANSTDLKVNTLVDVPAPQTEKIVSIQAHSAKVHSETGQIIGTVIVLRDITALTEVERMKARFMTGVTHELKTPLSIIQLHSKNLLNYYPRLSESKQEELLQSISHQTSLLCQLIEEILQLSRLDAGLTETNQQMLDLAQLLAQTVTELSPLAEAKQINLAWQKPEITVKTLADPDQLERLVRNLIDNAIKYTPPNGSVKVETFSKLVNGQPRALIRISDTGIGIPPEHQARIFDRFHRVDSSHTTPGTGLGLSIVKEIVNAHGGNIQLESTPGSGSTFVVSLPGLDQR